MNNNKKQDKKNYRNFKFLGVGIVGATVLLGGAGAFLLNDYLREKSETIPQSEYSYKPAKNWSYGIDIEGDGKEDIVISDPNKKIKAIVPVEGGYKIILLLPGEESKLEKMFDD